MSRQDFDLTMIGALSIECLFFLGVTIRNTVVVIKSKMKKRKNNIT